MKLASLITAFATLAIVSSASASSDFEFTAPGGVINDNGIAAYPLFMNGTVPQIATIELEINGLTHSNPWDLDIYLVSPFGTVLEILTDQGDQNAVTGANLLFNDGGAALPGDPDSSLGLSPYSDGAVVPEGEVTLNGSVIGNGFGDAFVGQSGGTDAWMLWVIDDVANNKGGTIDSFTLRGTYVPEPMSLSLLAAGAFAVFGRRKR
jgi:hypothetical protein